MTNDMNLNDIETAAQVLIGEHNLDKNSLYVTITRAVLKDYRNQPTATRRRLAIRIQVLLGQLD